MKAKVQTEQSEIEQARAQIKELSSTPALVLAISVNRISGALSFANNMDASKIAAEMEQAIGALEVITRELRREQLRLASEGAGKSQG